MSALSVRAREVLHREAKLSEPTPETVTAWIRDNVPPGHNQTARMHSFLSRQKNVGQETREEILAFAFGTEFLKRRRIRVTCSVCGEDANLQASGEMCDRFVQWWAGEHRHEGS